MEIALFFSGLICYHILLTCVFPICREPEPQILDYQTQQYKLFPLLAMGYAFTFVSQYMTEIYHRITEHINQGDFSELPEVWTRYTLCEYDIHVCRYLVKSYRQAKAGQQLSGIVSYLNESQNRRVQPQAVAARPPVVDINDLSSLVDGYKQRAAM
ncbi:hypothetical protein XENOCAPTIV_009047 [Xenoophorus captivus]|uniref:Acyl-CoA oxidase C-alpha1 domain-containing protein n=1 Tax=Xenoophorus captivus TaxID=1517983 RepID=A0ABV0R917_9TELE